MSKIEWTDETWNPIIGCSKISEGCKNCYAERMAMRLAGMPNTRYYKNVVNKNGWNGETYFTEMSTIHKPLYWIKPRKIFVCSMSDLFHESVTFPWIANIWDVMFDCPQHTFLILTKRPERVIEFTRWMEKTQHRNIWYDNIWLGVTCENSITANERIPILLKIPSKIRFLSVEPMLSGISLKQLAFVKFQVFLANNKTVYPLDWIICGAETGPGARPTKKEWVYSLRDQCVEANIPFFFKKWGNNKERLIDGKLWEQYPDEGK